MAIGRRIILLIAGAVVAFWYLAPSSMKQQVGLAQGGSPLEVMAINNDRQPLASGNDQFTVSGRIINPTSTSQPVPPLRAELLDESKKNVIHSWDDFAACRHPVAKMRAAFFIAPKWTFPKAASSSAFASRRRADPYSNSMSRAGRSVPSSSPDADVW